MHEGMSPVENKRLVNVEEHAAALLIFPCVCTKQVAAWEPALSAVRPLICFLDKYIKVQQDCEEEAKYVTQMFSPILFKQALGHGERYFFLITVLYRLHAYRN